MLIIYFLHNTRKNVQNIAKICNKYESTHKSIIEHECTEMYKILIGFVREFLRGFLELRKFLKVFENCFILYNLSIKALVCQ